jgi:hypothetical protein
MIGDAAVAELNEMVSGKLRFGDGSLVDIRGRGMALLNIYYIPQLKMNIASIRQLDEIRFPTHVEDSVMTIRDWQKRLIAKAPRLRNRLYVVHLQIQEHNKTGRRPHRKGMCYIFFN